MKNQTLFERSHRNSQKRIYSDQGVYFVTTVTHERFPFFAEPIFCELFVENLRLCKALKRYELYGWVLMHDHVHLLIQPNVDWNISQIMHSLKRNVSRNINIVLGEGEDNYPRLLHRKMIDKYKCKFMQKSAHEQNKIPLFRWQKSFHDHLIRDEQDLQHHYEYIINNPIKAEYPEHWMYVSSNERWKEF
ncbi:transposase [Candidatus Peregrinibacteria bacterium]|nr:MAG: transposase [Candidatus Peregrinibacteria bacterium]